MRLKPQGPCPPCGSPGAPQPCGTQRVCWSQLGTTLIGNPPPGYLEGGGTAAWGSRDALCILYLKPQSSQKGPPPESSCPPKHNPLVGPANAATVEEQPPGAAASFGDGEMLYFACLFPPPKMPLALSFRFPKGTHFSAS